MGLDVTAYKNIEWLEPISPEKDESSDYDLRIVLDDFKERASDIKDGYYSYTDEYGFRAGSYGGYNSWRNELAVLAGFESAKDAWSKDSGPFWELINFSDCEGTLGTLTCKKLLFDFKEFYSKAEKIGGWFFESYKQWTKGMELAAENGCFCFH